MRAEIADIVEVESSVKRPYCEGGEGASGHPRIYLTFKEDGTTSCYYCGRQFMRKKPTQSAAHE